MQQFRGCSKSFGRVRQRGGVKGILGCVLIECAMIELVDTVGGIVRMC